MKSELVLVIIFYWLNCHSIVHTKQCMDVIYQLGNERDMRKKYRSEWGLIGSIHRTIHKGSSINFRDLSMEETKKLCACAFIKRNPEYGQNKDFSNLIDTRMGTFVLVIGNYPRVIPHLKCFYGDDRIALAKSYRKKSASLPQWDIYVSKMDVNGGTRFEGVIKSVDLGSKSKAKKNS